MRAAFALAVLIAASGCLTADAPPRSTQDEAALPTTLAYHLHAGHRLSTAAGASATPVMVPAAPTANAFVNEDVEVFASDPVPSGFLAVAIRLVVYYGVDHPTVDAFRNGSGTDARHFVFWPGAASLYPTFATAVGNAVLAPGGTYRAALSVPVPPGGWFVTAGMPLQLLVAPLVATDGSNLHYLVDSVATDSRIELDVLPWTPVPYRGGAWTNETITVPANGGLSTGAVPDQYGTAERSLTLAGKESLLDVAARFATTTAGKSDLDLYLLDPAGRVIASSTTPYESEEVRLQAEQVKALGPGTYTVRVDVYSGVGTRFDLDVLKGNPVA